MTTELEVPDSTYITFRNNQVRLDGELTAALLQLLDQCHWEYSCENLRSDMTWAFESVGQEVVEEILGRLLGSSPYATGEQT